MDLQRLAVFRVFDLGDIAVGHDIGIIGGFEQRVDWCRDDVGGAQPRHPIVARAGREQLVEHPQQARALLLGFDDASEIAEPRPL